MNVSFDPEKLDHLEIEIVIGDIHGLWILASIFADKRKISSTSSNIQHTEIAFRP